MSSISLPQQEAVASSRLYRAVWRWHFYAGLIVVPFFIILAVSGLTILFVTGVAPEYGDWLKVEAKGEPLSVAAQADKALAMHAGGKVGQYIVPWGPDYPALIRVDLADGNRMLALNPYTGEVLRDMPQDGTWNAFMTDVHGKLLIGKNNGPGDFVVEIAASLGVIMTATSLYLWWPRNGQGFAAAFVPNVALKGRALWKSLHQSIGAWMSVILLFFLLSGLAWTGVWGGKFVQAWSSFPPEKWDNVPLSDQAHASMNHGAAKEVPWTLEQTLMPQSGSATGITSLPRGTPVVLDSLVALGRAIGFEGRFQIAAPADDKGVWTLSQDSMSYDSTKDKPQSIEWDAQFASDSGKDCAYHFTPGFGRMFSTR